MDEFLHIHRAQFEEILNAEFNRGVKSAIDMLSGYDPKSEEIKCCMHSKEWAEWLESKRNQ